MQAEDQTSTNEEVIAVSWFTEDTIPKRSEDGFDLVGVGLVLVDSSDWDGARSKLRTLDLAMDETHQRL